MAAKNRTDLKAENDALFPDNNTQDITPARKRQYDQSASDSNVNLKEPDTVTQVIESNIKILGSLEAGSYIGDICARNDFLSSSTAGSVALTADATLQLIFGGLTSGTGIEMDASGNVTFDEDGCYQVRALMNATTSTNPTRSFYFRTKLDGIPVGPILQSTLSNSGFSDTIEYSEILTVTAGQVLTVEATCDGNSCSLAQRDPSGTTGWDDPSEAMALTINKLLLG